MAAKNERGTFITALILVMQSRLSSIKSTPTLRLCIYSDRSPRNVEELIQTYRTGGGGVALLAELNGHPGPRHILDLPMILNSRGTSNKSSSIDVIQPEAIQIGKRFWLGKLRLKKRSASKPSTKGREARLTNLGSSSRTALHSFENPLSSRRNSYP